MTRVRHEHLGPASRWARIASGLMLCGLLSACGDRVPTIPGAPGTVSPTPTPSPAVTSAGYLHVLQRFWVMTYEIDPTGRLRPPVTQRVSRDLRVLAGEPQGRFLYGGHGGWSIHGTGGVEGTDGVIATYAPDPRDGTLVELSETTLQRPGGTCGPACRDISGWGWLKGGANRVHALWDQSWGTAGRHSTYTYVSIAVASDGQLGRVSQRQFDYDSESGYMLVDVRSDVLYKAGRIRETPGSTRLGGLEAHVIEPDGTLNRMGWTNLCLATIMDEYDLASPLVAARGFVFASFYNGVPTVCSYQGLRLKPLYALDLGSSVAEAFVPSSEAEPVLLAMNVVIPTGHWPGRQELRLFSMDAEGDLRPLAREELPDRIRQILFHPSGRFLYTLDWASGLRAYTIDSSGRLELTMEIDHAGESMAITLKDARAEDR